MRQFHFISGLPRSGSTLLSTILRQNPRFATSISSPVLPLVESILPRMSGNHEMALQFTQEQRQAIVQGILYNYYSSASSDVVFDTHRGWTSRMGLLQEIAPKAKVICCVRDMSWILDSLERVLLNNPLHQPSHVSDPDRRSNSMYARLSSYMNLNHGVVGAHWSGLREAWFGSFSSRLVVIRYESLVVRPADVINELYRALDERPFSHSFDGLSFDFSQYDERLGMPGLHQVRGKVTAPDRRTIVPPDLFEKYKTFNFWNGADQKQTEALVI